jgi:hypothetical protein
MELLHRYDDKQCDDRSDHDGDGSQGAPVRVVDEWHRQRPGGRHERRKQVE